MRQRFVTLLSASTFLVLAVTGVIAFLRPFSLPVVGLHSLMGFAFVALVILHVASSSRAMVRHLRTKTRSRYGVSLVATKPRTNHSGLEPKPRPRTRPL